MTIPYQSPPFSVPVINYMLAAMQNAQTAGAFANTLQSIAASLGQTQTITPNFPSGGSAPPLSITPPPDLLDFEWDAGTVPGPFNRDLNINGLLPDPFDGTPPDLSFGPAPAGFTDVVPSSPPINTEFNYPDMPPLEWPSEPRLLSINTYQFDGVTIPEFSGDVSELQIADPTVVKYIPGQGYTSSLLTQVDDVLQQRIQGSSAMPPEVEQAIWDRGRERELKQLQDGLAETERMESLGYAMPPGIWLDARLKLQTEYAANSYGHSREVMIKQAELQQQNVRHALDSTITLESRLIEQYNQIEQRTFETAKYVTNAGVEIYNAKVKAYSAYVEAYRTKVAIYEAKIKGLLATVEAYKAEMQAEEVKAQVNTALVNQYKTLVDVVASSVEIYKAELSAIQTKASVEKLKIEVYGEQVKAYVGKINAYTASVEGYKAATSAEATKQEAFKSSVEAYSAQVGAQTKVIDARIKEYEGWLKAKEVEYEGYKAYISAQSEKIRGISSFNSATSEAYKAQATSEGTYNTVLTKQWQVALDQAQRVSEIANNAAKMNADLAMQSKAVASEAAKVGAQVYSQLTAALINAVSWSTSYNVSNSAGNSSSYSESHTFSSTV